MSRWTHIRGGFELNCDPFEHKGVKIPKPQKTDFENEEDFLEARDKYLDSYDKGYYLPYPKEQFKLPMPVIGIDWSKDKENGTHCLEFEWAYIFSLPKARKYIEEAFKLLPQGETGFRYSLDQNEHDWSSGLFGFYGYPCLDKYYKEEVERLYQSSLCYKKCSFKDLKRRFDLKDECGIHIVDAILVGVRSDLRWCSGTELLKGLEDYFKKLEENEIKVEDGYLEWDDEYEPDIRYSWRVSRLWDETYHEFFKIDIKTNNIIWSKKYNRKKLPDGQIDWMAKGWDIVETPEPSEA